MARGSGRRSALGLQIWESKPSGRTCQRRCGTEKRPRAEAPGLLDTKSQGAWRKKRPGSGPEKGPRRERKAGGLTEVQKEGVTISQRSRNGRLAMERAVPADGRTSHMQRVEN